MPPKRKMAQGETSRPADTEILREAQRMIEQRFQEWQGQMQGMIQAALQVPANPPNPLEEPLPNDPLPPVGEDVDEAIAPADNSVSHTPNDSSSDDESSRRTRVRRCDRREPGLRNAFTRAINEAGMPERFKPPTLELYRGRTDPFDHVASFESTLCILDIDEATKCRLFLTTLKESALRWFNSLPTGTVGTFRKFRKLFTT